MSEPPKSWDTPLSPMPNIPQPPQSWNTPLSPMPHVPPPPSFAAIHDVYGVSAPLATIPELEESVRARRSVQGVRDILLSM